MPSIDSVVAEYLAECEELLQRVANSLRLVERSEWSADTIDSIYRDIHTIKGSAQLFGYLLIGDIGHAMETSLDPVRRERRAPSPAHLEALFRGLDAIERAAATIRQGEEPKAGPDQDSLVAALVAANNPAPVASPASLGKHPSLEVALAKEAAPLSDERHARAEQLSTPAPAASVAPQGPVQAAAPSSALSAPKAAAPAAAAPAPATEGKNGEAESASSIRVPVAVLDKLMILMGEMVLVRNQVLQYANRTDDLEFLNLSQRLDVVTSELQGEVMKTRMQPIGNVLSKFHRVVRDLSRDLGKKIELQLSGMETELDKTLLEAVKDPIMHIVRNSCDHGLEGPEDRSAAGKPDTGTIHVRSFHEGGQVIVEISDDGRGLNRDKLTAKAVASRGLPRPNAGPISVSKYSASPATEKKSPLER